MAMIHNLPPQAYTRDVLVKAIDWLATQPPATRERAMSADALVGLYLQARRRNSDWQEAPVSGENFKSDLKHLAQDLKQFDEPPPQNSSPGLGHGVQEPIPFPPQVSEPVRQQQVPVPPPQPKTPLWNIDSRSLAAAREIQYRLNLSSDSEAIRFLITLGLERARQMFP